MPPTDFTCPSCRTLLHISSEESLARMAHCPNCQTPFGQSGRAVAELTSHPAEPGVLAEKPKTSPCAIWGLVLGLLSLLASVCANFFLGFFLSMCVAGTVALGAVMGGIQALVDVRRSKAALKGTGFAVTALGAAGLALALPFLVHFVAVPWIETKAAKLQSSNNLKMMGLAMHQYSYSYDSLPPAVCRGIMGPNSKPRSWRVELLPYLGEGKLYEQYRFDEPWDGPNNQLLLSQMPRCYAKPGNKSTDGRTYYQVLVGPRTAFQRADQLKIRFEDLDQKGSKTVLIIEAAEPVPWTKPEDIPYDPGQPVPKLGGLFPDGFNALFSDGTVEWFPRTQDPEALRTLIHR